MSDEIRKLMATVIADGDTVEIGYEFTAQTEKLWIMNPDELADAIVQRLAENGYQIIRKDDLARMGDISNNASWYEEYRRGMSF